MKGAVDIITLIIVACMVVSIGLMLWFYMSIYYWQISQSGQNSTAKSLVTLSSCMKIEEASQNNFFVRNCGTGLITNDTLYAYVDDSPVSFVFSPSSLDAGKTGTLSVQGAWAMSLGQHTLRVTNPNFETSVLFDAELPDSCVLALDFEDLSGNVVYDKSGNGNNGVLFGVPAQTSGKFGKAIDFDGVNDYANFPTFDIPNTSITISFWIKAKTYNSETNWTAAYNTNSPSSHECDLGDAPPCYSAKTGFYSMEGYNVSTDDRWWFGIKFYNTTPPHTSLSRTNNYIKDVHILNKWQYIQQNWNGTQAWGYLNGILNSRNNYTSPDTSNYTNTTGFEPDWLGMRLTLGATYGFSDHFNGSIDEFRIYNKSLTPDQLLNFRLI